MLTKFKKIKDKAYFYQVLAEKTGCDPRSIRSNWFTTLFSRVPKNHIEITEKILQEMPAHEKECEEAIKKIRIKNFGL